jgi:hypothetical protein
MRSFKDFIKNDIKTFFNDEEFSSDHNINGKNVTITIDDDLLKERKTKYAEGTYLGSLLFYVNKENLDFEPAINMHIKYDGKVKFITDCQENMGVYTITLGENKV